MWPATGNGIQGAHKDFGEAEGEGRLGDVKNCQTESRVDES